MLSTLYFTRRGNRLDVFEPSLTIRAQYTWPPVSHAPRTLFSFQRNPYCSSDRRLCPICGEAPAKALPVIIRPNESRCLCARLCCRAIKRIKGTVSTRDSFHPATCASACRLLPCFFFVFERCPSSVDFATQTARRASPSAPAPLFTIGFRSRATQRIRSRHYQRRRTRRHQDQTERCMRFRSGSKQFPRRLNASRASERRAFRSLDLPGLKCCRRRSVPCNMDLSALTKRHLCAANRSGCNRTARSIHAES